MHTYRKMDLTDFPSEYLLRMLTEEMKLKKDMLVPLELDLPTLYAIVGQVQLALRHPGNTGHSADLARGFVTIVQNGIEEMCPATAESIRRGFDEQYDRASNE